MCVWRHERCKRHRREKLTHVKGRLECHSCLWEKQMDKEEVAAKAKAKAEAEAKAKAQTDTEKNSEKPTPKPSASRTPPQPSCPRCHAVFQTPTELNDHYDPPSPIGCYSHCACFINPNDALYHAHETEHDRCFFEGCPLHYYPMPGGNKQVINHILEYHTARSEPWSAAPAAEERDSEDTYVDSLPKKPMRKTKSKTKHRHHGHSRMSAASDDFSCSSERYDSDSDSGYTRKSRHHRHHSTRSPRGSKDYRPRSAGEGYPKYGYKSPPNNPPVPSVYAPISLHFPISVYPPISTYPSERPLSYDPFGDYR